MTLNISNQNHKFDIFDCPVLYVGFPKMFQMSTSLSTPF